GNCGQLRIGPRYKRPARPRGELVLGQPAPYERVLEDVDHLLAVSIGRPDVAPALYGRHLVPRSRRHQHLLPRQRVQNPRWTPPTITISSPPAAEGQPAGIPAPSRLSRRERRSAACRRRTACRSGCTCPARVRLPAGCSGERPWSLP